MKYNNKNQLQKLAVLFSFSILLLTSCKKDTDEVENPPVDQNETELITTFEINYTLDGESTPFHTAIFRDIDGDGGNEPSQFDTIILPTNSIINAQIILLNESQNPADTISNEVLEEAEDHLFCFDQNDLDLEITRTDTDGIYEVGLESQWNTGDASEGSTTITLKHQPGIKDGTCAPGETDIELNFITYIED